MNFSTLAKSNKRTKLFAVSRLVCLFKNESYQQERKIYNGKEKERRGKTITYRDIGQI